MPKFIDYVPLMLFNLMAGYFLLAYYVYAGLDDADQPKWAPGFLIVGLISAVFGGIMSVTWPIPSPYAAAFGDMSVLFGIIFLGAGLAMARGWSLKGVTLYAFFAGWVAIIIGIRFIQGGLTLKPVPSGLGFILSGFAGVMAAPTLAWMKSNRPFRTLAALVVAAPAVIWAVSVFAEYWLKTAPPK